MENLTGKQLGQYRIVAALGEGEMAAVYKAYQPTMDRYVAIKILPRYYATDPTFMGRFEQEAEVIAHLEHPNILPVHDYGEAEGYTYLVMRLVVGGTLANLLHGRPLPLTQIQHIIYQIGDALDYAHSRGVVHRDVKPSNILIDERGNCLLTDFGIAKMVASTTHFTVTGGFVGTPAYASPEQCQGQDLDGRSDIYSLGVVLYEMTTGRPPFEAETPAAVVIKHVHDPLPPPRTLNPALPEAVERVILKALAKEREHRYQTAGEMVRALTAVTREETPRSPRPVAEAPASTLPSATPVAVAPRPHSKPHRREPAWGWIVGLLFLCILLAVAGGVLLTAMQPTPGLPTEAPTQSASPTPIPLALPTDTLTTTTPTQAAYIGSPSPQSSAALSEPFSTDVFASGSWTRSDSSAYVDTTNNWLRITSDGGNDDYAEKAVTLTLPITLEYRSRVVSGGRDYGLPNLCLIYAGGSSCNDAIMINYNSTPSVGWIFNKWGTWTGVHTKAPRSENMWVTVRATIRSEGGGLLAKYDTDTSFTSVAKSTWAIPNQIVRIRYYQSWDSVCDVDYISISSGAE